MPILILRVGMGSPAKAKLGANAAETPMAAELKKFLRLKNLFFPIMVIFN
jgi:hypothetical protein